MKSMVLESGEIKNKYHEYQKTSQQMKWLYIYT